MVQYNNLFTLWLQTQSGPQSQYQQNLQTWHKLVSDYWQMPAAYWQTVSSIMGARASTLHWWWQNLPVQTVEYSNCKSWPEFCGQAMRWYGQQVVQAVNLGVATQTYRSGLLNEWQTLAQRNLPGSNWQSSANRPPARPATPQPQYSPSKSTAGSSSSGSSGNSGTSTTSSSTPVTKPAVPPMMPAPTLTPVLTPAEVKKLVIPPLQTGFRNPPTGSRISSMKESTSSTSTTTASQTSTSSQMDTQKTVQKAENKTTQSTSSQSSIAATAAEALANLNRQTVLSQQAGSLKSSTSVGSSSQAANGTTGSVETTSSSTSSSVARTNTGSVTAAAAARRSVVARRTQKRSRIARTTR